MHFFFLRKNLPQMLPAPIIHKNKENNVPAVILIEIVKLVIDIYWLLHTFRHLHKNRCKNTYYERDFERHPDSWDINLTTYNKIISSQEILSFANFHKHKQLLKPWKICHIRIKYGNSYAARILLLYFGCSFY